MESHCVLLTTGFPLWDNCQRLKIFYKAITCMQPREMPHLGPGVEAVGVYRWSCT